MRKQKQVQLVAPIILALLGGCVNATESRNDINLFEPHEYGTYERPIPSGKQSADAYPWADGVENIVFHTLEESEATEGSWKPLQQLVEDDKWLLPTELKTWAWTVHLVTRLNLDAQATRLNSTMLRHRGVFYGLGGPMLDSTLHLFECTGEAQDAVYLLDDILVECRGSEGLVFTFPTVELETERLPHEPRVAPRWYDWWKRIYAHAKDAWSEPDPAGFLPVDIFIYASGENVGVRSTRQLKVEVYNTIDSFAFPEADDYFYAPFPSTEVPPEHCKNPLNRRGECEI